jgi:hypothetical protein
MGNQQFRRYGEGKILIHIQNPFGSASEFITGDRHIQSMANRAV